MKKILIAVVIITALNVLFTPSTLLAQSISQDVREFGSQVYRGDTPESPQVIIVLIIRTLLTFLGILFVVLIIYGGFLWMTAAGKEDQVAKAKKVLTSAIIGLLIIVLSYTISEFIIRTLTRRY